MKNLIKNIKTLALTLAEWVMHVPYRQIILNVLRFIGGIMNRALFTVLLPKRYRNITKLQIYNVIFKSDTPAGKKFDIWLLVLIVVNILVLMLDSIDTNPLWLKIVLGVIEWTLTVTFTFEYYLRIYCLNRPKDYVLSRYGLVDFFSIFPSYLSLFIPATQTLSALRLLRVMRLFRIFRMDRFVEEGRYLVDALRRSAVKVGIFMLFVLIMAVILGAAMYGIEGETNPQINSIPNGIYWAVVTITTVGYGDITPMTSMGRFVSVLVMLLGYAIIAVPTGIVAGETIDLNREQRKKKKTKRRTTEVVDSQHEREAARLQDNQAAEESAVPSGVYDPRHDQGVSASQEDLL